MACSASPEFCASVIACNRSIHIGVKKVSKVLRRILGVNILSFNSVTCTLHCYLHAARRSGKGDWKMLPSS
jgi:hypothetical protein